MKQLEFNLGFPIKEGEPLYPQPPKYTDCMECWQKIGHFGFFEGNEMEGHVCVYLKIINNPNLMPKLVSDVWIWSKIDKDLERSRKFYCKI